MNENTNLSLNTIVTVPTDHDMANQPATAIASAMQLKNAVVSLLAISGLIISPVLDNAVSQVLAAGIPLVLLLWSFWSTHRQGQSTKSAVYSPSSAAAIAIAPMETVSVHPGRPADAVIPTPVTMPGGAG